MISFNLSHYSDVCNILILFFKKRPAVKQILKMVKYNVRLFIQRFFASGGRFPRGVAWASSVALLPAGSQDSRFPRWSRRLTLRILKREDQPTK